MTNVQAKQTNAEADALLGTLNILIADDHRLLGEAVANLLRAGAGYSVKTAETYEETVKAINNSDGFDIVLLDLKMPGMVGLDSVKSVVERAAPARVVLFTGQIDRHFLNSALDLGVRGLIPKTMPLQSLTSVIQLINSGQVFVPMQELNAAGENTAGTDAKLSEKEMFVLRLAADGMTNKEIARDLNIAEPTVKLHMKSLYRKMKVSNRTQAALVARDKGLF